MVADRFTPHTDMLIPQSSEYTCGPACAATVAAIYGVERDYAFFCNALEPDPDIGTPEGDLAAVCRKYLPCTDYGEESYRGGVSIAFIIHRPSGDEHYVVFLDRRGDDIVYYEPYDDDIVTKPISDIEWGAECGRLSNWSVNFTPIDGADFSTWEKLGEDLRADAQREKPVRRAAKPPGGGA